MRNMPKLFKKTLTPPATKPGYIIVEAVDSADGGMCLVMDHTRIAGCEPTLNTNNVRYRWNVREEYLQLVLDSCKKNGQLAQEA